MRSKKKKYTKIMPEKRAVQLAQYIVENNTTIRAAAKEFGVSKSTVHKDVSMRLPKLISILYYTLL